MSFRSALSHRQFRWLWFGQLVSRFGDSIHEIALVWIVYDATGDPVSLSITFLLSFIPSTVFSIPSGVLADRVNRKYVLVVSDLLRAGAVLTIPLVGPGPNLIPLVFTVAFVTGLLDAVDTPARMAMIPSLVPEEELDSANSLSSLTFSVSRVLLAAGGVVVAIIGSFGAFYVDAASFVVSAGFTSMIPTRYGVPDPDADSTDGSINSSGGITPLIREAFEDAREVLAFVSKHRALQNLVLVTVTLQFIIGPITVGIPPLVAQIPFDESLVLGILYAAFYTGVMIGSVGASRYSKLIDPHRGWVIVVGFCAFGVSLWIAVQRIPTTLLELAGMLTFVAVAGIVYALISVSSATLKQVLVPNEGLGRYTSVTSTVASIGSIIGLGITGPVVKAIGPRTTILLLAGVAVIVGVFLFSQPITDAKEQEDEVGGLPSS